MTAKTLKPYPKYKDSGVSWIGMVPVGWEVVRGKNLYNKVNRTINDKDEVITCFRDGVVTLRKNRRTTGFTESIKEIGYQGIRVGDLVIHAMDAFAGAIGVSDSNGKGTPVYNVCEARMYNINNYYYAYLLREMARIGYIQSLYKGIRERTSEFRFDVFAEQYYPLPPRSEQDDIVAYLDDKTAKIDRLIGLYKREIELLKERRQAVIHKAVTRGLDDKVKLKDSGVSWIGMVPVGWGVSSVGRLYSAFLGKMLEQSSNFSQPNSEYKPYICAKDVHFDGVDITDSKLMKFNKQEIQKYSVKRGDLLIVEGGAGAGGSAIYNYDDERMVQNSIHVVRSRGFLLNRYLYYWMYSLVSRDYIDAVCNKATIPHFTGEKLTATMIPLPPRPEQDDIVAYLDDQCAKIDAMIGKVQSKIGLLEEYRVRLISDVVTGKVRV